MLLSNQFAKMMILVWTNDVVRQIFNPTNSHLYIVIMCGIACGVMNKANIVKHRCAKKFKYINSHLCCILADKMFHVWNKIYLYKTYWNSRLYCYWLLFQLDESSFSTNRILSSGDVEGRQHRGFTQHQVPRSTSGTVHSLAPAGASVNVSSLHCKNYEVVFLANVYWPFRL